MLLDPPHSGRPRCTRDRRRLRRDPRPQRSSAHSTSLWRHHAKVQDQAWSCGSRTWTAGSWTRWPWSPAVTRRGRRPRLTTAVERTLSAALEARLPLPLCCVPSSDHGDWALPDAWALVRVRATLGRCNNVARGSEPTTTTTDEQRAEGDSELSLKGNSNSSRGGGWQ